MFEAALTRHAEARANQRGVQQDVIEAILHHADVDVPVGGGCSALRLSKRRLKDAALRKRLGSQLDRLAGIAVVCSDETGEIVTVLHDHGGADGRRYRRLH
ncbi:MAG: hypothetical protein ACREEY_13315 [Brevundimonas sp.]